MTKKKIRYSEMSTPAAEVPGAAPAPAPVAPAPAEAAPRAPLGLARALAAARAAEEAAAVLTAPVATVQKPAAPLPRRTPIRGSVAIPRLTPVRGSIAIVRDAAALPAPAPRAETVFTPRVESAPTPRADAASTPRTDAAPTPRVESAPTLRDRARLRTGSVDLLVFAVGAEWFGIELAAVEEAIDLPAVRHVPEMPPAMLGVITVRETLTSVYSPAAALGVALREGGSSLVFRRARGRLGIAVDDVDDVHTLDLATLRDAPATDTLDGVLLGVLRHRDSLLALVDAEALIGACQSVPAMETA